MPVDAQILGRGKEGLDQRGKKVKGEEKKSEEKRTRGQSLVNGPRSTSKADVPPPCRQREATMRWPMGDGEAGSPTNS